MKILEAAGGLGLIALLLGLVGYLKQALDLLRSVLVTRREVRSDAHMLILRYVIHGGLRRWSVGAGAIYDADDVYVPARGRVVPVAYRATWASPYLVFWYRGAPVLMRTVSTSESNTVHLYFVHGTVDVPRLLHDAIEFEIAALEEQEARARGHRFRVCRVEGNRFNQYALVKNTSVAPDAPDEERAASRVMGDVRSRELLHLTVEDLGSPPVVGGLDTLSLTPELEDVVAEARYWLASKDWCVDHQVPWKHGFSFEGPPGTGKTAMVRALAEELDLPLFVFDLASMTNRDLARSWEECAHCAPCLFLIEDIDGVFHGREPVSKDENTLTFDCLLNQIDGVEQTSGVLLVITTNRPELLDPALAAVPVDGVASRPCRIDRVVEFGPLDEAGRRKMARRILDADPELAEQLVQRHAKDTPAQFQDRCVRAAAKIYWSSRGASSR